MPTHIGSLTPQQQAALPAYRDHWIAAGLQTGETDWATFDHAMPICYAKAGFAYPPRVVRVQSPLVGALAAMVADGVWRTRRQGLGHAVDGVVVGAVRGAVVGAAGASEASR